MGGHCDAPSVCVVIAKSLSYQEQMVYRKQKPGQSEQVSKKRGIYLTPTPLPRERGFNPPDSTPPLHLARGSGGEVNPSENPLPMPF
ncbi:MAG: hypothetical protein K8L91_13305, partial [Anaerolineae bacterium]|nr:hypothetical protein [Anaerolineae bacterium]